MVDLNGHRIRSRGEHLVPEIICNMLTLYTLFIPFIRIAVCLPESRPDIFIVAKYAPFEIKVPLHDTILKENRQCVRLYEFGKMLSCPRAEKLPPKLNVLLKMDKPHSNMAAIEC